MGERGSFPHGTSMVGVHVNESAAMSEGSFAQELRIGMLQRNARQQDFHDRQVACTSFDIKPPVVWSLETHASFPAASRQLVHQLLLVQRRLENSNSPFVPHELFLRRVLPMLVE